MGTLILTSLLEDLVYEIQGNDMNVSSKDC